MHGCKSSRTGAFAEVVVADAGLCFKVPDTADLEAACTLGVGWISAAQALRQRLYNDEKKTKEKKEEGGGSSGGDDTVSDVLNHQIFSFFFFFKNRDDGVIIKQGQSVDT